MASPISEFKLPLFLCLWLDLGPDLEPEDVGPAGLCCWIDIQDRAGANDAASEVELALLLVSVKWDCLTAGVSSMMVAAADGCADLMLLMRCMLAWVSSLDLSPVFSACGRWLTRLLAATACKFARVGIGAFLPDLDFLTWMGRAVTFLATIGFFMMPLCV